MGVAIAGGISFMSMLILVIAGTLRLTLFRWFKFTLKPPYSIARDKL